MLARLLCVPTISLAVLGAACTTEPGPHTGEVSAAGTNVPVELTGDVHTTARTGNAGVIFVLGDGTSDEFALFGLSGKEHSDDPCWVHVKSESINDISQDSGETKDLCGSAGPNSSSLLVADFADTDFTGERAFVSGVEVCMNSDQSKVKGWELFGRQINANGSLSDIANHALAGPRPNCDTWKQRVDCAAGEIATAMQVHFDSTTEPRSWLGVALKCRHVSVQ
jgi:hypothetical protein